MGTCIDTSWCQKFLDSVRILLHHEGTLEGAIIKRVSLHVSSKTLNYKDCPLSLTVSLTYANQARLKLAFHPFCFWINNNQQFFLHPTICLHAVQIWSYYSKPCLPQWRQHSLHSFVLSESHWLFVAHNAPCIQKSQPCWQSEQGAPLTYSCWSAVRGMPSVMGDASLSNKGTGNRYSAHSLDVENAGVLTIQQRRRRDLGTSIHTPCKTLLL